MKKLFQYIVASVGIIFALWLVTSTVEVAMKNYEPSPQYSPANFWSMLVEYKTSEADNQVEYTQYIGYGRYYTNGTVVTNDGNEWTYTTDTISDKAPYDGMPVWVAFNDNGTPNEITDDIILGLVYDRNTAIYDDLETALSDKFELEREGNNIKIGGTK